MRALLVANVADTDAGYVGHALRLRGYAFTEIMREHHEHWSTRIDDLVNGADLVVSMGSGWSVYWPEVAEAITAESSLLRHARDRAVPILGVCFGAQILAHALGGKVFRATQSEIGWCRVFAHQPDSLAGSVLEGEWMQWHYDTFEPPTGAEVVASSDHAIQAFHIGRSLGVQFHPEATEAVVSRWSTGEGQAELVAAGIDPVALHERTRALVHDSEARCDALVNWFLADIAGKPDSR